MPGTKRHLDCVDILVDILVDIYVDICGYARSCGMKLCAHHLHVYKCSCLYIWFNRLDCLCHATQQICLGVPLRGGVECKLSSSNSLGRW